MNKDKLIWILPIGLLAFLLLPIRGPLKDNTAHHDQPPPGYVLIRNDDGQFATRNIETGHIMLFTQSTQQGAIDHAWALVEVMEKEKREQHWVDVEWSTNK